MHLNSEEGGMIVMWLEAHGTEPADLEDLIYENKTQVPCAG